MGSMIQMPSRPASHSRRCSSGPISSPSTGQSAIWRSWRTRAAWASVSAMVHRLPSTLC